MQAAIGRRYSTRDYMLAAKMQGTMESGCRQRKKMHARDYRKGMQAAIGR
jgi:hypothetical protein